jgi:hypothetical protein
VRTSAETWWRSFEATIVAGLSRPVPPDRPDWAVRRAMTLDMIAAFTPAWQEREHAIAAYEAHNAAVRAAVPAERLIEWQPGDGWEPLCSRLGLAVPAEPFPNVNSTEEFQATQHAPAGGDER